MDIKTEALTAAVSDWLTDVLPRLGPDQHKAWEAMLEGKCDVGLQVRLREGSIVLVAISAEDPGHNIELYRQEVGPLR